MKWKVFMTSLDSFKSSGIVNMKNAFHPLILTVAIIHIATFSIDSCADTSVQEVASGLGLDTESACQQALSVAQARAHQKSEKYVKSTTESIQKSETGGADGLLLQNKVRIIESRIKATNILGRKLSITDDGLVKCRSIFLFIIDETPIVNHFKEALASERERVILDRTREAISVQIAKNTKAYSNLSERARSAASKIRSTEVVTSCRTDDLASCDESINKLLVNEIKRIVKDELEIDPAHIDAAIHRQQCTMRFSLLNDTTQQMIWSGKYSAIVQIRDPFENQNRLFLEQLKAMDTKAVYYTNALFESDRID